MAQRQPTLIDKLNLYCYNLAHFVAFIQNFKMWEIFNARCRMGIVLGLVIGVSSGIVSSLIASSIFRNSSYRKKPKINISNSLIKKKTRDGTSTLRLKLVNKSDKEIANIRLELHGLTFLDDKKQLKQLDLIAKRELPYIAEYNKNLSDYDFAHQIGLHHTDCIHKELDKYENLRLLVIAECPFYGTMGVFTKVYDIQRDIRGEEYSFALGDSTNCIKNH